MKEVTDFDENTTLTYTVGSGNMTIVKQPVAYKVVKVTLTAGSYEMSFASATESYANLYLYSTMVGGKGSGAVKIGTSSFIYNSSTTPKTGTFTIDTAGTYYIATTYSCSFSIVAK